MIGRLDCVRRKFLAFYLLPGPTAVHMAGMETIVFDAEMWQRFLAYGNRLAAVLGNAARERGLFDYLTGLLLPGDRKSMEPMAAQLVTHQAEVSRRHQAIHHFTSEAQWDDLTVRSAVQGTVLPAMQQRAPIRHWIIDDTTLPKKGTHSVGVGPQYSGQVGHVINCQTVVSLALANAETSLPVDGTLYLPEDWALDVERRLHAGVPAEVTFRTKPEIALDQVRAALAAGLPRGVVLADAAYGQDGNFRKALRALKLAYAVGIQSTLLVVPQGRARPAAPRRAPRAAAHAGAVPAGVLARALPSDQWQEVTWRDGDTGPLTSRFAAVRVRTAPSTERGRLGPKEWLLVEAAAKPGDRRFWLLTLPANTSMETLVYHAKGRNRVEQDYRELKQDVGLDRFQGRGWRGFNHHVTLCLAAYGFLVRERSLFPPRPAVDHAAGSPHQNLHPHPLPIPRPDPERRPATLPNLPQTYPNASL